MPTWLNVAEKNDAAKSIAGHLSRGQAQRFEGRSPYNKIYKFRLNLPRHGDVDMVFTSVSGHLLTQDFGAEMTPWSRAPFEDCFTATIYTTCPDGNRPIMETLQSEARKADCLLIWTDCDREGEAIGFEVIDVCRQVKRTLPVWRARFSEITAAAVWRAVTNLVAPDPRLNDAVLARSELDLRTGAAFTRLQTLKLKTSVPQFAVADGQSKIISYGSCQFPTLGFVVERYKARQEFVEESFWKLRVSHRKEDVVSEFTWARNRLFQREAVEALLILCQMAEIAVVNNVRQKPKSRWRPVPLDTVELEKLGVRKLRMSAKQTLDTAEKLYQKGYISYPRTETNIFPADLNLVGLVEAQAAEPAFTPFANDLLARGVNPRRGTKSDQAHPPIHPLKAGLGLNGDEARVFDLIARHFLACLSRDASGSETIVEIELGGEEFVATGLVILDRGYLEIYPFDQWSAKVVGRYTPGETFRPDRIDILDGQTTAPPLLTEADLITLMDKHGIGTDATHAQHIATIQDRSYVGLTPEARFVPGFLGLGLVEGYEALGYRMAAPHLRAEFEAHLRDVCEGRKTRRQVLDLYVPKYRDIFTAAEAQFHTVAAALRRYFANAAPPQPGVAPPHPVPAPPAANAAPPQPGVAPPHPVPAPPAARGRGRGRGRGGAGRGRAPRRRGAAHPP